MFMRVKSRALDLRQSFQDLQRRNPDNALRGLDSGFHVSPLVHSQIQIISLNARICGNRYDLRIAVVIQDV